MPESLQFEDAGINAAKSRSLKILRPVHYSTGWGITTVPAGFITDGASIPRIFWSILGPQGPYFHASILHDYLYSPENKSLTRLQADLEFWNAMTKDGVRLPTRVAIFRAVRLFGGKFYRGYMPHA